MCCLLVFFVFAAVLWLWPILLLFAVVVCFVFVLEVWGSIQGLGGGMFVLFGMGSWS